MSLLLWLQEIFARYKYAKYELQTLILNMHSGHSKDNVYVHAKFRYYYTNFVKNVLLCIRIRYRYNNYDVSSCMAVDIIL